MKKIVSVIAALGLAIAIAPSALAKTTVQGGPLTNLNPAGDKIHLALSGYPTAHGLYVFQAVQPSAGARPTQINTASQVWIGTAPGATDPKGDIVVTVDNGHAWGADCAHQVCGLFLRLDHTASTDTSEDQFIPITFAAATTPVVVAAQDTLAVKIDGVDAKENIPGKIAYRQVVTFSASSGSGAPVTFKSYTPDLCPLTGNTVTALKGSGQCDIAATVGSKSSHFPFIVGQGSQTVKSAFALKVNKKVALDSITNFGEKVSYKNNNPKNCSLSGNTVKAVKAGKCTLIAHAQGTDNYSGLHAEVVVTVK